MAQVDCARPDPLELIFAVLVFAIEAEGVEGVGNVVNLDSEQRLN